MRKLLTISLIAALFMSCGVPKTVQESKKVIKGYWNLNSISYSESGNFNVTLLNDTSKECFEGSTWRFIPNNNSGVYTINNGNCPMGDRDFIFTIQQIDQTTGLYDFLLKPTNEKHKSETGEGYRLRLAQLTDNSMKWEQTVSLSGQPFTIYMNFSKINE